MRVLGQRLKALLTWVGSLFDGRRFIHLVLTLVMAGIAVQLTMPTDTFGGSSNWRMIADVLSEAGCGGLCGLVAIIGGAGLVLKWRAAQVASIIVLATAHGAMALAFLFANPAGIGALLLSGFAFEGYYLVYRRTKGT